MASGAGAEVPRLAADEATPRVLQTDGLRLPSFTPVTLGLIAVRGEVAVGATEVP